MALNKQTIINNSKKVYACMYQMVHYTFNELQKICQLGNTELCLALVQLIQENKIKQDRNPTDTGKQNQTRQKRARNLLRLERLTIDKRF